MPILQFRDDLDPELDPPSPPGWPAHVPPHVGPDRDDTGTGEDA